MPTGRKAGRWTEGRPRPPGSRVLARPPAGPWTGVTRRRPWALCLQWATSVFRVSGGRLPSPHRGHIQHGQRDTMRRCARLTLPCRSLGMHGAGGSAPARPPSAAPVCALRWTLCRAGSCPRATGDAQQPTRTQAVHLPWLLWGSWEETSFLVCPLSVLPSPTSAVPRASARLPARSWGLW